MENGFIVPLQRRSEMKRIMVTSRALIVSTSLNHFKCHIVCALHFAPNRIFYTKLKPKFGKIWKRAHTKSWHARSSIDLPANNITLKVQIGNTLKKFHEEYVEYLSLEYGIRITLTPIHSVCC